MRNNKLNIWLAISLLASVVLNIILLCSQPRVVQEAKDAGWSEGFDAGVERGKFYVEAGLYFTCQDGDLSGEICNVLEQQQAERQSVGL